MSRWLQHSLSLLVLCTVGVAAQAADPQPDKVTARDAWARATAPGMTMGAVYVTLQGGATADRLVAATTPRAATTQLHVVTETDGMVRMRETEGIEVPPGATVTLAPQGTHLMLMNLTQPLVAGERFPLTLRLAEAGTLAVNVLVVAPGNEPGALP